VGATENKPEISRPSRIGQRTASEVMVFGTASMTVVAVAFFLIARPASPWLGTILDLMIIGAVVGAGTGILLTRWRDRVIVGFLSAFLGVAFALFFAELVFELTSREPREFLLELAVLIVLLLGIPSGLAGAAGAVLTGFAVVPAPTRIGAAVIESLPSCRDEPRAVWRRSSQCKGKGARRRGRA